MFAACTRKNTQVPLTSQTEHESQAETNTPSNPESKQQRIIYKLMLYIYKALNDMAPCYISAVTHLQNTPAEYMYRQRLRSSSDQTRLVVSRSFKRAGDMSFTIAAARLWNDLPVYLHESQSLPMFKRQLKTHLFP